LFLEESFVYEKANEFKIIKNVKEELEPLKEY